MIFSQGTQKIHTDTYLYKKNKNKARSPGHFSTLRLIRNILCGII